MTDGLNRVTRVPIGERRVLAAANPVDVVVIGGGITGIQVAREAAGRGLSVVLCERGDFGEGTSAATSKLIHGGIRYLEHGQVGVVRESLRERRLFAMAAPHLVEQRRFVLPAWRWSRPPTALLGAGVGLYSLLGADANLGVPDALRISRPGWLSRRAALAAVPWLDRSGLQGAFVYHDTVNIHPERLLLAIARAAVDDGAALLNHMEVTGLLRDGDVVRGVMVTDRLDGRTHRINATTVVNASGPWIDLLLDRVGVPGVISLSRSKGVHLLTTPVAHRPDVTDTVFARTREGRHVIVTPWQGMSLIGPTDTPMSEHPDHLGAAVEDVEEILTTVNATMDPHAPRLEPRDVIDTTVGIRPLLQDPAQGTDTYRVSRRHEIRHHAGDGATNLWTIGGGKWTTGRATAEAMIDALYASPALAGRQARRFASRRTAVWGAFGWAADPTDYLEGAAARAGAIGVDPQIGIHLARLYGTEYEEILEMVRTDRAAGERVSTRPGRWDIAAQVHHAISVEGAGTLRDLIDRRLVLGTLGAVTLSEIHTVARLAAAAWGWSASEATAQAEAEHARRLTVRARWERRVD